MSTDADTIRLDAQRGDVWRCLRNGHWWTLAAISKATGHPEASISARIRDFRKERFGAHDVESIRIHGHATHHYRLIQNRDVRVALRVAA